jgi:predicted nucleic acid-binding Zn ribbon protein
MEDNRIEHLENRVVKLEETVAPLSAQMNMLIETSKDTNLSIKETNMAIKELTRHMEDNYVSEKVCKERCPKKDYNENKNKTMYALATIAGALIMVILKIILGV